MIRKMVNFGYGNENTTTMIALTRTYHDGQITLDDPIEAKKPMKVIVTFLEEDTEPKPSNDDLYSRFSFEQARELSKDYKGSFSDAVIEERRED